MKGRHSVGVLALAAFAVIVGAFVYGATMAIRVDTGYEAEVAMQAAQSAVRNLQISTRALRSEPARLAAIVSEWRTARQEFDRTLQALHSAVHAVSADTPEARRLANIWERMQSGHDVIEERLAALRDEGMFEAIGNASVVAAYREWLDHPPADDEKVADLGLLLFYLEHVDRVVLEMDSEMLSLDQSLRAQTKARVFNAKVAAATVLTLAFIVASVLLWRIARLYASARADLAARQKAEEAVRASEADLNITLDAIGDAVVTMDERGVLRRLNPAAESLLLCRGDDARGRTLAELCSLLATDTRHPLADPLDALFAGAREAKVVDRAILVRSDGTERTVATLANVIRDSCDQVHGLVLVIRDISERERLEEQLRRTQRTESIGQLAGGVAHDFNNILQVIQANTAFLAEAQELSPQSREHVVEVQESARRATDLTRQLLALGRRQTLQARELDPVALVRSILKLVQRVIGEHIEMAFSVAPHVDWIRADPGQIEQVVLNLCFNARDAMPNGGRLAIALSNVTFTETEARETPGARAGPFVRISVSDSGVGMSTSTLGRVFEPFFTTKAVGKGSGLGLSVVQGIVHQHGGMVSVSSQPGRGTTVEIHLPAIPPIPAAAADMAAAREVKPTTGNELILLVEDEAPVRNAARAILVRFGYRVLTACDGVEACELARDRIGEISAAVLDVVMPRMGGIDAAHRLRELNPALPIILCTGYAGGANVHEISRTTGWAVIAKPYDVADFIRRLQHAMTSDPVGRSP